MKAFFPGTFNPFTIGHKSIVDRALTLFDTVVVAVGINADKADDNRQASLQAIRELFADEPRVEVTTYSGLTCVAARDCGADVLLRGIRSVKDFEYERDMADANRAVGGIETLCLFADPALGWVSSSIVRDLNRYGADTSKLTPKQ